MFALLLGGSVMLSALFWLPPFSNGLDRGDLDRNSNFGSYEIVASFMLGKPISLLKDNIYKLEDDIIDEIEAPTIKVKLLSLISTGGSNITKVVFAIVPDDKHSKISETGLSLIRANFMSLVVRRYSLRLTASLFGDPFSFEVLKFIGGITVIPPQGVFLLQKVQILFNFTLNSSINQTQENFFALTSQLKSGLHLASYENLYIKLTNPKGSTVAIPTTVQTAILLAIGMPSQARLKQLAQTITDSHAKNLGLSNTVFGKVKQVRLSSILQHSLGNDAGPTPAPFPMPHSHRYHHHHHHHGEAHLAPILTPAPSPACKFHFPKIGKVSPAHAPVPSRTKAHKANPPGCQFGHKGKPRKGNNLYHFFPPVEPPEYPEFAPTPPQQINPPAPVSSPSPALSPLPRPVNAHVRPPAQSEPDMSPLGRTPSILPSPSSSFAGCLLLPSLWLWAITKLLVLILLLR